MDDQGNAQEIHCPNIFKEPMLFLYRHYCDICPVQRPINLIISGQDCSILLQHFQEASKFETTRISIQLMHCSLK